jgi:outer membrane lipoprotein-sorting protein
MRSSARRSAALAPLLLAVACACTRPRPAAPAPQAPPLRDPAALIAAYNAREAQVRTLRSTFSATITRNGSTRTVSGILIIAKPDRFRFRLMLPFGVTVFDEVRVGRESWLLLPLGTAADVDTETLEQGLLPPPLAADRCTFAAPRDAVVDAVCADWRIALRASDATLAAQWLPDGSSAQYQDERPVDGVALPFRIALTYAGGVTVDVRVEHYDVNPVLAPDLFVPPAGAEHRNRDEEESE